MVQKTNHITALLKTDDCLELYNLKDKKCNQRSDSIFNISSNLVASDKNKPEQRGYDSLPEEGRFGSKAPHDLLF